MTSTVHIAGVAAELPAQGTRLEALQACGELHGSAALLAESGFGLCRISDVPASTLAERAVARLLAQTGTDPASVPLLVSASALPPSMLVPRWGARSMLEVPAGGHDLTRFGAMRLQHRLGLTHARVLGVAEAGCVALLQAVWLAQCVMAHEGLERAVCVSADVMPAGFRREVLHSVMSDAGCAVLLERGDGPCRLLAHGQLCNGWYWDADERGNELLAAYYPAGRRLVERTLGGLGLGMDDIACVLPNNVSLRSWQVMSRVLGLPLERVYTDNIARNGHAMACDNFVNLADARAAGRLRTGDRALLYGFGLGAHWACAVIEA